MPIREVRDTRWFVEPLDAHTNEIFGKELDPDRDASRGLTTSDGKHHNLYEADWDIVNRFVKSKHQINLQFRIFSKEGGGQVRQAPEFLFMRRKWTGPAVPPKKKASAPSF